MAERDFLDKMIAKRIARNPEFPRLMDAARRTPGVSATRRRASRTAEPDLDSDRGSDGNFAVVRRASGEHGCGREDLNG